MYKIVIEREYPIEWKWNAKQANISLVFSLKSSSLRRR